jgi:hypothetical protein
MVGQASTRAVRYGHPLICQRSCPQKSKNLAQKALAFDRKRSVTDSIEAQTLSGLSPAGPWVRAGLRQCGGSRRSGL